MSTFEDHLWSELVSDHGEQIRQAGKATATLAASQRESSGRRRWQASSARPIRRQLALAAAVLAIASLASVTFLANRTTKNPTAPRMSRAAFAITDNHDGTLSVTLNKRSALRALNASLARYGLKAKLPGDAMARTALLTATCPKPPTRPVQGRPAVSAGPPHAPTIRIPQRLKSCVLHAT